jgi:hypothetical protein
MEDEVRQELLKKIDKLTITQKKLLIVYLHELIQIE